MVFFSLLACSQRSFKFKDDLVKHDFETFPKKGHCISNAGRLILFARMYNREFAKQYTIVSSLISQTIGTELFTESSEGPRDSARDLKFAKLKTNMAARVSPRQALFPPSLVSCLRHQLF